MLTEVQEKIVTAPLGAMLVTAGAGSGKTRVLTHRIAHVMEQGIPDWAIVALTFTNKAAAEMKHRVEAMRGHAVSMFLGTFHSFCARLLRRHIHNLDGYSADFTIYDAKDSTKVLKEIVSTGSFPHLKVDDRDPSKVVAYHLGAMKNSGKTIEQYAVEISHLDECDDIIRVIELYEKQLRASGALDFDDLLVKVLNFLSVFLMF